jgi:hypothetical protein
MNGSGQEAKRHLRSGDLLRRVRSLLLVGAFGSLALEPAQAAKRDGADPADRVRQGQLAVERADAIRRSVLKERKESATSPRRLIQWGNWPNWYNWGNYYGWLPRRSTRWRWPGR